VSVAAYRSIITADRQTDGLGLCIKLSLYPVKNACSEREETAYFAVFLIETLLAF
jgi:hypothetical protein